MMKEKLQILEEALQELLKEASAALAALERIAGACPSVISVVPHDERRKEFRYPRAIKDGRGRWETWFCTFAEFVVDERGLSRTLT
jgi:hypothetical protein